MCFGLCCVLCCKIIKLNGTESNKSFKQIALQMASNKEILIKCVTTWRGLDRTCYHVARVAARLTRVLRRWMTPHCRKGAARWAGRWHTPSSWLSSKIGNKTRCLTQFDLHYFSLFMKINWSLLGLALSELNLGENYQIEQYQNHKK